MGTLGYMATCAIRINIDILPRANVCLLFADDSKINWVDGGPCSLLVHMLRRFLMHTTKWEVQDQLD